MAEIVRAVGLRGELKTVVTADFDEEILASRYLQLEQRGQWRPVEVTGLRWKGDTPILRLAGVTGRDPAEALVGATLGFRAEDYDDAEFPRPEPPLPFCYEGLMVETDEGEPVGEVAELLAWPGQRMMRVRRPDGRELLVPAVHPIVREIDRAERRIVIRPIPGLIDDDAESAG